VTRYCARLFAAGRRFDLVPARANGQPAFGAYLRAPAGIRHATDFYVLTLTGDQVCAMTRFEASVLPWFGPQVRPHPGASQRPAGVRSLPARPGRHPPRDRLLRAHPGRRSGLRHDPLRGQRAAVVRAAAIAPGPVTSLGAAIVSSCEAHRVPRCSSPRPRLGRGGRCSSTATCRPTTSSPTVTRSPVSSSGPRRPRATRCSTSTAISSAHGGRGDA
jgi:hypothetical protein